MPGESCKTAAGNIGWLSRSGATPAGPEEQRVHASAVVIGELGILIRGASGAGKSELAQYLIVEARQRGRFARLIGDDRVCITKRSGRVIVRPHPVIAGKMEKRWEGIACEDHEPAARLALVVDLVDDARELQRMPEAEKLQLDWGGARTACIALPASLDSGSCAMRVLDILDNLPGGARQS